MCGCRHRTRSQPGQQPSRYRVSRQPTGQPSIHVVPDTEVRRMAWDQKRRTPADYIDRHKAQRVLIAHAYVCHICSHDDAHDVDHIIPWAEWTRTDLSVDDASNLAPAHGSACPTLSLIHISEPTRQAEISYAVFCLKKKKHE